MSPIPAPRRMTAMSLVGAVSLLAAGLLAGCSTSTSADHGASHGAMPMTSTSGSASSEASSSMTDVMFAQMMIPHHEQAVEMADLALANPDASPALRELATQIKAAQQPEIDDMTAWLEEWGAPVMMDGDDHSGHGMGDHGMDGMMSDEEMQQLEQATGADFERLWLELMIRHHEGALDMANGALTGAGDPRVIELANAILVSQAEEIATMRGMLASS